VSVDIQSYGFMPLAGGYEAPYAHKKFLEDRLAYGDAGVSEGFLFKQMSNMFKDHYWSVVGMWQRVTKAAWDETAGAYNKYVAAD